MDDLRRPFTPPTDYAFYSVERWLTAARGQHACIVHLPIEMCMKTVRTDYTAAPAPWTLIYSYQYCYPVIRLHSGIFGRDLMVMLYPIGFRQTYVAIQSQNSPSAAFAAVLMSLFAGYLALGIFRHVLSGAVLPGDVWGMLALVGCWAMLFALRFQPDPHGASDWLDRTLARHATVEHL